jgi:hypothetical protein
MGKVIKAGRHRCNYVTKKLSRKVCATDVDPRTLNVVAILYRSMLWNATSRHCDQ